MSTQETSRPARGNPLIRQSSMQDNGERRMLRLIPAALISVVFHVALFAAFMFLLPGPSSRAEVPTEAINRQNEAASENTVQPDPPSDPPSAEPLTVSDVDPAAIEPDTNISYNVERTMEEVAVPGIVRPDEPIGIESGSKTAPPISLALPPGLGGGTSGGLDGPMPGTGLPGEAGGYNLKGMPLAGSFYGRSGATKEKALREGGGTKDSEAAVTSGLIWMAKMQSPDGRWRLDGPFSDKGQSNDVAGTAFGLLPFLGAGKTHKAAKDNPFDKPIERGLLFLMRQQDKKNGNLGGGMYGHSIATIALCEAYGLTQDPALRRPAQGAVNYLITSQHSAGGWRYAPNQAGDTSVTGWAVMAIKSAKMAGLDVPELCFRKAVNYLDTCRSPTDGYGYVGPGATPTMSAVGLLCRQYLQAWGPQNLAMIKGVENNIRKNAPRGSHSNMYYYYYATQVMHHFGGESWTKWNEQMREALVKGQDKSNNPNLKGSWSSAGDPHCAAGGRLMETSLCLLTLEVYYRHLPLYYREAGERQQKLLAGQ